MLLAFICLAVIYADFRMTKHNMGVQWNGIGCVDNVNNGIADAPMQYRVLVPWLCRLFRGVNGYLYLRMLSICFAIVSADYYFQDILATAMLGFFFVLAALYDYTDGYIEVGLFALAFTMLDSIWLIPITLLATLNREVGVFIPIACLLSGYIQLAGLVFFFGFVTGYIIPRLVYGDHQRYCEFFTLKRNLQTIKAEFTTGKPFVYCEYTLFFILTGGLGYLYSTVSLGPVESSMGLLFLLLLIPTMWREVRVFSPVMLAAIPMALR